VHGTRFNPVPLRFSAQRVDGPTDDTLAGLGTIFHDRSRSVSAQGNNSQTFKLTRRWFDSPAGL
jgi:hypothetical protein